MRVTYPALLRAAKLRAERLAPRPSRRHTPLHAAASDPTSLYASLDQLGLSAADGHNQLTPSDSTGAVGPGYYVEIVNGDVAVYSTVNLGLASAKVPTDAFVGTPGNAVFDVQMQWDPRSERFFYLADDCASVDCSGSGNTLAFGWSKTSDPRDLSAGGWCSYRLPTGTAFADFPKLGQDDSRLIFGANDYLGATYKNSEVWVVPKPAASDAGCSAPPTAATFGSPSQPLLNGSGSSACLGFTPVPVDVSDQSSTGYVVGADDLQGGGDQPGCPSTASNLTLWTIGGTAANPTMILRGSNLNVAAWAMPPPAPQAATSDRIDTQDTRLSQAVGHRDPSAGGAEAIWTQQTVAGGAGSAVRWYEIVPAARSVRQQGTIANPSNYVFNGAISPSSDGAEAAITYNESGPGQSPDVRFQGRNAATPLSQMSGEVLVGQSTAADVESSCTSVDPSGVAACRWGDYSGMSPDSSNPNVVWGTNMLNAGGGSTPQWTTRNFAAWIRRAPTASARVSSNPTIPHRSVVFDGGGSRAPDSALVAYNWSFGDGASAAGRSARHVYARPGSYTAVLTVTDDQGATGATLLTIDVQRPLKHRVALSRRRSLSWVLGHGFGGSVRCSKACNAKATLILDGQTAKRLRLTRKARSAGVGSVRKVLRRAGSRAFAVRLSRPASRAFRGLHSVRLTVRVVITDAARESFTTTAVITLRA